MSELDEAVMRSLKRLGFMPEGEYNAPDLPNLMPIKDYSNSCPVWGGAAKVIEECGELTAILGKLIVNKGSTQYYDNSDLEIKIAEEIADVIAAISFFMENAELDQQFIVARTAEKVAKFNLWRSRGE